MKSQPQFSDLCFVLLTIVLALAIRLDFLLASNFIIDADEAIVGLMGLHWLQNGSLPAFYYGQHYMGSLEPLLAGVTFLLFGVSAVALKAVPLFFSLVFVLLCFLLGRHLGGRSVGRIAALLAALPPATLVVWSSKARGGFIEVVVLGSLALLFTSRWFRDGKRSYLQVWSIGLVLGFGWWVNNQILYYMVPVFFAFLFASWKEPKKLILRGLSGIVGFLLGGLPFWVYNLCFDWASFQQLVRGRESSVFEHLQGLFETALPILLGGKRYWQSVDLYPGSTEFVYFVYVALISLALLQLRKSKKVDGSKALLGILLLFCVTVPAVFVVSSFGYLAQAPRYLLPFYSGFFPLVALAIVVVLRSRKLVGSLLLITLLGINLVSSYYFGRAIPGEPFIFEGQRVSRNHDELVQWLRQNQVRWVRTNYWIGYRLAFETQEYTRFVVFQEPLERRITSYEKEGKKIGFERMPFVLVPAQAKLVKEGLSLSGYRFQETMVSGYSVIYQIESGVGEVQAVSPETFSLITSDKSEHAPFALDGDVETRWGSGRPQSDDMQVTLRFHEPRLVSGIEYDLGKWVHDYPRILRLEVVDSEGISHKIVGRKGYAALRYLLVGPSLRVYFEPMKVREIVLSQRGEDPVFDWSIAELRALEPETALHAADS